MVRELIIYYDHKLIVKHDFVALLTLKDLFISESCIEIKIKASKAFIKPFEAPQRSVKIKI